MNKNLDLKKLDGIIWDMDGVIVDVSKSYREVIRKTAEYFLNRKVLKDEVDRIKNIVGMNNDWDASYALINNITDTKNIIRNEKNYQEIKDIFQVFYLGSGLFKKCYKKISLISVGSGLINSDSLLISRSKIQELRSKYRRMGIATGRPRFEAEYVLNQFDINKYFDCVICMEDTKKGKPEPDPILKVVEFLNIKNSIYIGDSPNDVIAANKAGLPSVFIGKQDIGDKNFKNINELLNFLL